MTIAAGGPVGNRAGKPKPIHCPTCGANRSRVVDVRDVPPTFRDQRAWSGAGLWRKRQCLACQATFSTEEIVLPLSIAPISSSRRL